MEQKTTASYSSLFKNFITHTLQMELLLVIITIIGIDYFITHTVQMEHATPWYIKKRMDAL